MSAWSSPDRTEPPQISGERASLDAWVDYHRTTLLMKCADLEPERLVERSCPPSTLSLLGLVRHLTEVEGWFHDFDGEPPGEWYSTDEDPDARFDAVDPSRADADLAAYEASVVRARRAVENLDLDETSPEADDGETRLVAPDLSPHDRGVRTPQRTRGHPEGTDRRCDR